MTQRIIKRYENRKLYDTTASGYVSLSDIAAFVRTGETIQVIDNASGDDLTAATLTQIILDEGKKGKSLIPTDLLHDVLRRSSSALESSVSQIKQSVDGFVHDSLETLSSLIPSPKENQELQDLRQQLNHLESMLGKLLDNKEK